MELLHIEDRRHLLFPELRALPGLVHAVTTRPQDLRPGAVGERPCPPPAIARALNDLRLDPAAARYGLQIHGAEVVFVDTACPAGPIAGVDALVTTMPGVPLLAFSADCPLILLYDPRRRVLALVHASWRCTVAQLVVRALELMQTRGGSQPSDLHAGISPSAGPCCYEVQDDVVQAAQALPPAARCFPTRDGRRYFDLWSANTALLTGAGVPAAQIEVAGLCTMCRTDLFHSYRREGAGCGRFALVAGLSRDAAN
jgi:hypothetical protein